MIKLHLIINLLTRTYLPTELIIDKEKPTGDDLVLNISKDKPLALMPVIELCINAIVLKSQWHFIFKNPERK